MRQLKGKIWVGRAKVVFSRVSTYFGYVNFVLMLSTFYVVKGYVYAPAWVFLVGAVVGVFCIGMVDYFMVLPSEQAFLNEQAVKHQNPIYDELLLMKKDITRLGDD